jgi:hypothetical protein
MNTHSEHGTIRSSGFLAFDHFTAMIRTKVKAWREQRAERALIEQLEALGPEVLDDIGVKIEGNRKTPKHLTIGHPYVIAATALGASHPKEHGER